MVFKTIKRRLKQALQSKYILAVIVLLAFAIGSLSLNLGLQIDDYWHYLYFSDSPTAMEYKERMGMEGFLDHVLFNMFGMFHVFPHQNRTMMESGFMPWWASPEMRLSFFRPLSVLTHWPEYRLLRDHVAWMHLHNVIWYAALALSVTIFYRRMFGYAWVAGLAGLVFVLHDSHASHLISISQRNALISVFFGVWSILFFMQWRVSLRHSKGLLAFLFFILSILSADTGITILVFLLSCALYLENRDWAVKLKALVPFFVFGVFWRLLNGWMGYGAFHNEMYIDPSREPMRFIGAVFERVPILLNGMVGFPPPEFYWFLSYKANIVLSIVCAVLIVLLICVLYPLLRQSPKARFWALSAFLAVIPVCAVTPDSRNLLFAGIAAIGLMTQFISGWAEQSIQWPRRWFWWLPAWMVCIVFVLFHVVLSPAFHVVKLYFSSSDDTGQMSSLMKFDLLENEISESVVVMVNPPVQVFTYYPAIAYASDQPIAKRLRLLGDSSSNLMIKRLDDNSLSIQVEDGYFPPPGRYGDQDEYLYDWLHYHNSMRRIARYYRSHAPVFQVGDKVKLSIMTAEILSLTDDNRPLNVAFHFDRPLEEEPFRWVQWNWDEQHYKYFELPEVGQEVEIKKP